MGDTTIIKPGIITPFPAVRERYAMMRREKDLFCIRPTEEQLKQPWGDDQLVALFERLYALMQETHGDCKQAYLSPEDYDRLVALGCPLPDVQKTVLKGDKKANDL